MNDTMRLEFMECDTCRAKPGTPELCRGCFHNRTAIYELNGMLKSKQSVRPAQPVIADHPPPEMYQSGLEIDCQCALRSENLDLKSSLTAAQLRLAEVEAERDRLRVLANDWECGAMAANERVAKVADALGLDGKLFEGFGMVNVLASIRAMQAAARQHDELHDAGGANQMSHELLKRMKLYDELLTFVADFYPLTNHSRRMEHFLSEVKELEDAKSPANQQEEAVDCALILFHMLLADGVDPVEAMRSKLAIARRRIEIGEKKPRPFKSPAQPREET